MCSLGRMGICWSEPPVQQTTVNDGTVVRYTNCNQCGGWVKQNLEATAISSCCDICLQKNAMRVITPSAPPMYPPQQQYPHYTYAVPQQQIYLPYQQHPIAYMSSPYNQYRPPQQQMGTGTAIGAGFLAGMIAESMLDPSE